MNEGDETSCQLVLVTLLALDEMEFTEPTGICVEGGQSNRAYIRTHGVSGIDWKHYKHPLPERVYNTYMKYWADISCRVKQQERITNRTGNDPKRQTNDNTKQHDVGRR